jgi:hypothetical protein
MDILELSLKDRALDYVNKLIVQPLVPCGQIELDEYDIKQLAEIVQTAIEKNKSNQQLASDFGHYTKKWNITWDWVAHHILWDFHNIRQAQWLLKSFKETATVYKEVEKTDCIECRQLYLSDPTDINSEPKTFQLKQLIKNGSNLGKTKENWKAVIGVTDFGFYKYYPYGDTKYEQEVAHYYDNNSIANKADWHIWDKVKRQYIIEEKPLTERQKKIRGLIKITVTTEDGRTIPFEEYRQQLKRDEK